MYGTELRRSGRGTAQHRKIRRHLMKTLLQGWNGQPYFPRRKIKPPQTHLTQCRQRLEPGGKQNSVLLCCAEGSGPCTVFSWPSPTPAEGWFLRVKSDLRESHSKVSTALANSMAAHALSHSSWPLFLWDFVQLFN